MRRIEAGALNHDIQALFGELFVLERFEDQKKVEETREDP
jgi:hypothetical protein